MKEKQLYEALVDGIKNWVDIDKEEYIDISGFNLSIQNDGWELLKRAHRQAISDHPEYFYVNKTYFVKCDSLGRIVGIMPNYFKFAKGEGAIEQCQEKLDRAVANALSQVKGIMEPVEILLRLYDYFAENCVYTWEVATKQIRKAPQSCWSAYGALCMGNAVCRGIATAFKIVLDRLNNPRISCRVIASREMDHVWNLVEVDGEWYHMDVNRAVNDVPTLKGKCPHTGFLFSDEKSKTLRKGGYRGWQKTMLFEVPTCSSEKFDKGWAFDGVDLPMYRKNGSYFWVKKIGYRRYALFSSEKLSDEGKKRTDLPLLTYEFERKDGKKFFRLASGIVWRDRCLYYVNAKKELTQYRLSDGANTILGEITFTMQPSLDGYYGKERDGIGLYFDKETGEIVAASRTRKNELARFAPPNH